MHLRSGETTWDAADKRASHEPPASAVATSPRAGLGNGNAAHAANTLAQALIDLHPAKVLPVVRLHGVELHAIDEAAAIEHIITELDAGRGGFVVTPNLDHLRRCVTDLSFSALVSEADLVVADGMPLVWASKLQGTPLPGRVAGSDLIWSLSAAAAKAGRSIFLLGGAPGTADAAAKTLLEKHPALKIVGTQCPPIGFDKNESEIATIINTIAAAKPDIIFVALGSPKQEYLIDRIRRTLPGAWWLGVGISFSFVCGDVKRAPRWVQRIGMEWVHRLVQEPRRLFKRYILVGMPFATSLLARAAWNGINRKVRGATPELRSKRLFRSVTNGNGRNGNGHPTSNGNGHSNGNVHAAGARSTSADAEASTAARLNEATHSAPAAVPAAHARGDGGHAGRALSRLRALVLLGGSVRQTQLTTSIGRSLLDLPVDEGGSILNHWLNHASELARYAGLETLPLRVLVNRNSPEPISAAARYAGAYRVERDGSEFRGTGGVLRDLAHAYDDEDLVLVANAAQLLLDPLSVIAAALDHKRGDIALISHQDGTPSGVMLIRCKTLRLIPATGFVDMKEQALPLISSQFDVKVMHCRRPSGLPIRSLADYIAALRHYHRRRIGKPASTDPLAEDWQPAFAIVEDGATVAPRAHVHDSVVLKGAVVETGAAVVRSLVCPGGVVRQKTTVVDEFCTAAR